MYRNVFDPGLGCELEDVFLFLIEAAAKKDFEIVEHFRKCATTPTVKHAQIVIACVCYYQGAAGAKLY